MSTENESLHSCPQGTLCLPFVNGDRLAGESDHLKTLKGWLIQAAHDVGIELTAIEGSFDSAEQIATRIYKRLQESDLVVSVINTANANVFFETGYALGWGKPVLFIVKGGEKPPFDIAGIEHFAYKDLSSAEQVAAARAMRLCIESHENRISVLPDVVRMRQHLMSNHFGTDLFGKCVRHTLTRLCKWMSTWKEDGDFEFIGSTNILEIGTFLLENLLNEGFATQYYSGHESWRDDRDADTPDEYFKATRDAVARGCRITRIYILDHTHQVDEDQFRASVWGDISGGVHVKYLLTSSVRDRKAWDFGLWDDQLFAEIQYIHLKNEPPRLHRCRYSSNDATLLQARRWRDSINKDGKPCPDLPAESPMLIESARSFTAAVKHFEPYCRDSVHGKKDCSAYHLTWQRLRLADMVSSPRWHGEFYTEAFREWAESLQGGLLPDNATYNVLICGLADYAMLYWVAQSIGHDIRRRTVFHVLDICRTPLETCKWLVRRLQSCTPPMYLDIQEHHCDILNNHLEKTAILI